jgi:DNA mismatch repair protein MutL
MSSSIRLLSEHIINQIAAGEVIENAASVVKELVENSIDAGSSSIEVTIEAGGARLICVSDNGIGMNKEDISLCMKKHATSKIKDFIDLFSLSTLGFRGEALSSIASISKMKIETFKYDKAYVAEILNGEIKSIEPTSRTKGTTIEVCSLFYNVPVRKNFQKANSASAREIVRLLNKISLAHPSISFSFFSDGKKILHLIGGKNEVFNTNFEQRTKDILGKEIFSQMLFVSWKDKDFSLTGYIGNPDQAKKNRSGQYLFINSRPVFCSVVSQAVKEGYKTRLGEQFFPSYVLHFSLPPKYVDVNVHPQKKEIRLREEYFIQQEISKAVSSALQRSNENTNNFKKPFVSSSACFDMKKTLLSNEVNCLQIEDLKEQPENKQEELFLLSEKDNKKISFSPVFLLDSFFFINTKEKFFLDQNSDIIIIDLFSAYNRYLFESFRDKRKISSQTLTVPYVVDLSHDDFLFLEQCFSVLHQIGFVCRIISNKTISIDAYPSFLKKNEIILFFQKFIHEFSEINHTKKIEAELEKMLARKVSSLTKTTRNSFSYSEAILITEKLFECEDKFHSPLGKLTILPLTKELVEKFFHGK